METICMITTGHGAFDRRVFLKEARSLSDYGYDVRLIGHSENSTTRDGVEIISLGTTESRAKRYADIGKAYYTAKEIDADIYQFHEPEFLPAGVGLSKFTDGKVVFDIFEDFGQNTIHYRKWIPYPIRKSLIYFYPQIQELLSKKLDAVITTTDAIAEELSSRGYPNVTVVKNFPMVDRIRINKNISMKRKSDYILSYVGGLTISRGVMRMVKVVKHLRDMNVDVELWLIGEFKSKKTKREVENYITDHEISNYVCMVGYINHTRIFDYLINTDVGLSLLDEKLAENCLPTKIIEYMYAGIPVVSTKTKTTKKYVSNNGVFVEEDPKKASKKIKSLLTRTDLNDMGMSGKQSVLQEYNWKNEEKKLIQLYEDLLDE